MKVTKAKGLNAKPLSAFFPLAAPRPSGPLGCSAAASNPQRTRRRGLASLRPRMRITRNASIRSTRIRGRGIASRAVECAGGPIDRGASKWPAGPGCRKREKNASRGVAFSPFALVTFIWASQMKVTRPPGRDPAGNAKKKRSKRRTTDKPPRRVASHHPGRQACHPRPPRPASPRRPCPPRRCATRPAPASSRRSAARPFPSRSCCG